MEIQGGRKPYLGNKEQSNVLSAKHFFACPFGRGSKITRPKNGRQLELKGWLKI